MTAVVDFWRELSSARRWQYAIGLIVLVYAVWALATGKHGWLHQKAPIGIVLVGVVYGSVTALGAFGLVLVYRANKLINFAHGALGSLVGVTFIGLMYTDGLNYWAALPLAIIGGGLVGGITEVITMRRFEKSTRLIATIATVGLAGVFGGLELIITSKLEHFTALVGAFSVPWNVHFTIDVYTFHSAEVLVVLVVPAVIAFLSWFMLRTNAGVAVRAASENSDRALLLGIPVRKLSTLVWVIAGALAALTYVLQAPFAGVKPGVASNGPTVLLPLLTAAIVARMESLPIAFAASIGLGITYQVVYWNSHGSPNLIWAIYLGVIVVSLLAQSGKLSRAQESGASSWSAIGALKPIPDELRRVPEVLWARRGLLAALAAAFVLVPWSWGPANQLLAAFAVVWALIGVSLVVLTGWGGDISLGQFGIAGLAGILAANMMGRWNVDFFLVMAAAGAAGAVVALIVGLPALRIKGLFLAATTLALAVALDEYFLDVDKFPQFIPPNGVPRDLLLQRFDLNNEYEMYLVCLFFLLISVLGASGLRKARAGRVLIATKDNQRAAEAAAVPTVSVKLGGFMVAGVIAGFAGALDVALLTAIQNGSFPSVDSITAFSYAVIGGLGSIAGALIGVFFFKYLESITALGTYHLVISSVVLLWVLSAFPGGLGQILYGFRDRLLRMVADRRGILVPSLVADKRQVGGTADSDRELLTTALGGPAPPTANGHDDTVPVEVQT